MPKSPKTAPAPAPAPKTSTAPSTGVTSVQLLTVLTTAGLDAFEAALDTEAPSLPVLKKLHGLIDNITEGSPLAGVRTDALRSIDQHCIRRSLNIVPSRGRQPPVSGDRRRYRVQQLAEGGPFLRLSMASLGLRKGDAAHVDFEDGRIVVTPGPSAADAEVVDDD